MVDGVYIGPSNDYNVPYQILGLFAWYSDKVKKWTPVWTNASPTSSFATQTIGVQYSNYTHLLVEYIDHTSYVYYLSQLVPASGSFVLISVYNMKTSFRRCTPSNSKYIHIGTGYDEGTAVNDSACIPVAIYGAVLAWYSDKVELVQIWSNANWSSDFAAQTISADLSKAVLVIVRARVNSGSTRYVDAIIKSPASSTWGAIEYLLNVAEDGSEVVAARRSIRANETGVIFDDGYTKHCTATTGGVNNSIAVPRHIYALVTRWFGQSE